MYQQEAVALAKREYGVKEPLVIVHGLFGSGENWQSVAQSLAADFRVIVPDLRNHGDSPHAPYMDFETMAADLRALFDTLGIQSAHLMGHSLGVKVLLRFAMQWPDYAAKLVMVDMTAGKSKPRHAGVLDALLSIPSGVYRKRSAVDAALSDAIPNAHIRAFLLKGMQRNDDGALYWKTNIEGLAENYRNLGAEVELATQPNREALLAYGGRSDYVNEEDVGKLRSSFPRLKIKRFPHAGHWLHVDAGNAFVEEARAFLLDK